MKKPALLIAFIFITGMLLSTLSFSAEIPLRVVVDGKEIIFPDAKPFIDSQGRTQTPVRFIGEALGAKVSWDGSARKAIFEKGSKKLMIYIDKKEYEVNGKKMQMDTVALLQNDRTFVPARYVAEAFGATVRWESVIRTVYIETKDEPAPTASTGDTKNVAGFVVPKNIDLTVVEPKDDDVFDAYFTISFYRANVEKQKDDTEKILLQKLSQDAVNQIMSYIRPKMDPDYILNEKVICDKKTNIYIVIQDSVASTITIWISKKGVNPELY